MFFHPWLSLGLAINAAIIAALVLAGWPPVDLIGSEEIAMTGGRIALLVTGIVLALIGFGVAVGGGGILWAHSTYRGPDGS